MLQRQRIGRLPRTGAELASRSSIPASWGLFLHRLATSVEATRILELGSCGGVSGAYLATAPSCERFVGVEGSPALATAAGEALATLHPGAIVLEGLFEERLDDAVAALGGRVELVFVDGERRAEGLTELVRRLQPVLGEEGTLAVDDVRVTREFHRAWRQATAGHWSLDLGRMGISSARPGPARSLAPLTGIWLARKPLPTV